jgi:hypothetical protein
MKAAMVKILAMQNPAAYDMIAVDKRIIHVDVEYRSFRPLPSAAAARR